MLAALLGVVLVMIMAGTVSAAEGETWYFTDNVPSQPTSSTNSLSSLATSASWSTYLMSMHVGGTEGNMCIERGDAITWIADRASSIDISFPAITWDGNLAIVGADAGSCAVEIGRWIPSRLGGGAFIPCGDGASVEFDGTGGLVSHRDNPYTVAPGAFDLGAGEHLACRIRGTWGHTDFHCGYEDSHHGHSHIGCHHPPTNPVPELPTVLLLGVGLVGIAGVLVLMMFRGRSLAKQ